MPAHRRTRLTTSAGTHSHAGDARQYGCHPASSVTPPVRPPPRHTLNPQASIRTHVRPPALYTCRYRAPVGSRGFRCRHRGGLYVIRLPYMPRCAPAPCRVHSCLPPRRNLATCRLAGDSPPALDRGHQQVQHVPVRRCLAVARRVQRYRRPCPSVYSRRCTRAGYRGVSRRCTRAG